MALGFVAVGCQPGSEWSDAQYRVIQSLSLASLREPPAPDSNRVATHPLAASLGEQLFNDPALSATGRIACASCHQSEKRFTDGLPKGRGEALLSRNTPTVAGLAWHTWFYWDGRKDSLWSQSLAPLEAGAEMNTSRLQVARLVGESAVYRKQYETLFGTYPQVLLDATADMHASPTGDIERQNNWNRLPQALREQVNTIFTNVGKAIGAYVRTIEFSASDFDRYATALGKGEYRRANRLLDKQARRGLALFIDDKKTQCLRCHNGPLFSNFEFHNIGSGNFDGEHMDFGRMPGLQSVLMDEFNCQGPYSDAPPDGCDHLRFINRQPGEEMQGAYKTPTLRDVGGTAPYFHDGRYQTLREVLGHYADPSNTRAHNPLSELNAIELDEDELAALEAFLRSLGSG